MNQQQHRISRVEVGSIAALCLVVALGLWVFSPENEGARAAFFRVGVVMAALWFAVPAKGAAVAWNKLMPIIAGSIVLIAMFRKVMIVALPAAIAVGAIAYFLRPRTKQKPGH